MVTNNNGVAKAWINGKAARSHNGNFSTDGKNLYSYRMLIGRTVNGEKQVLNVRGNSAYSVTTSQHVSDAIWQRGYDKPTKTIEPVITSQGYGSWRRFPETGEKYTQRIATRKTQRGMEKWAQKHGYNAPEFTIEPCYGGYALVWNLVGE